MSHGTGNANIKMSQQWTAVRWGCVLSSITLGKAAMVWRQADSLQEVKSELDIEGYWESWGITF